MQLPRLLLPPFGELRAFPSEQSMTEADANRIEQKLDSIGVSLSLLIAKLDVVLDAQAAREVLAPELEEVLELEAEPDSTLQRIEQKLDGLIEALAEEESEPVHHTLDGELIPAAAPPSPRGTL
jgi:hypothetical protein